MKKIIMLAVVITTLFSCTKENDKARLFKGGEVTIGHGKGWNWIKLNKDGAPEALGITLTNSVLSSLSTDGHSDGHSHNNVFDMPLHPQVVKNTPFKYISLDWNPAGHPPANVYTLPHFDLHYYMVPKEEVMGAIDMQKILAPPAAAYLPSTYVAGPPVPQMGMHWLDKNAPELQPTNPATFTQTFIYGSYNGKVTFYEPMVTLEFLKQTQHFQRAIPQPQKVAQTGYYPTGLRIVKDVNETSIILEGFVFRQAS